MAAKEKHTRKVMHEKRRKNTKLMTILMVFGVILIIALISIWLFGGGNDESEEESGEAQSETTQEEEQIDSVEEKPEPETVEEEENNVDDTEEDEGIETKEVEPSDANVVKAYEGNWNPVGTEQEGPHSVNFTEGSQDRVEMRNAILLATGLNETDYREWWFAGGGEQKVIATVSDSAESEIYRVYLSWVDGQGWQPTKVEELRENDWRKYQ